MNWMIPDTHHELLWDHGMCADTSRGSAVRELMTRAVKGALAPAQQKVPLLSLPFSVIAVFSALLSAFILYAIQFIRRPNPQ